MGRIVESIVAIGHEEKTYTDIHVIAGSPLMGCAPTGYIPLGDTPIEPEDIHEFLSLPTMAGDKWRERLARGPIEISHTLSSFRVRCSVYETLGQEHQVSIAIRILPLSIPDITTLGLPPKLELAALSGKGLFLITGPTGSGKSTTMAALLDRFNARSYGHILTIEQPIEYLLSPRRAIVSQVEVGTNVPTFADGVTQAMRHRPTIIAIGEVLDSTTADAMLRAASTGHTVLATMHTRSCVDTIESLQQLFQGPDAERKRGLLSSVLRGIITQILVPAIDEKQLILAYEIFLSTAIRNAIDTGRDKVMCTMDETLNRLVQEKKISGIRAGVLKTS